MADDHPNWKQGRFVRDFRRADPAMAAALSALGVATVHEAMGRSGLMQPQIRPLGSEYRVGGPALTVSLPPGDNLMIHVALAESRPGDILVVVPTSPSTDGYFGELLAISAVSRSIAALVIDAGVRDSAELRRMRFPVWSSAISARGTLKVTPGHLNVPVVCAGVLVSPGDVVVADDDGVCVVPVDLAPRTSSTKPEYEQRWSRE